MKAMFEFRDATSVRNVAAMIVIALFSCRASLAEEPAARAVTVRLPLNDATDDAVFARLEAIAAGVKEAPAEQARRLLVLEFLAPEGTAGEGSEFESALKLARLLSGERFAKFRTAAFLPNSVKGHAVLAVLACDEIVIASQAEFGAAGCDEPEITDLLRAGYREIAERRRTIPSPLALAMLDRGVRALKVQTLDGARVIAANELAELEKSTTVASVETLNREGEAAIFTGRAWRHELGYASHLAENRAELLAALKLPSDALEENPLLQNKPKAVRVNVDGPMNRRHVDRVVKIIDDELRGAEVNLIFLVIRSEGGDLAESVRLAHYLTFSLDREKVRTVAYVMQQARSDAAIPALACDELVMEEGAILGGSGAVNWTERDFAAQHGLLAPLMERRDRAWSPAIALAGDRSPLRGYHHAKRNERRIFSDRELSEREDRDAWTPELGEIELTGGISPDEAVKFGLAQKTALNFAEMAGAYRLESSVRTAEINWALALVEKLADRRLAGLLLFIGTFALFNELSQPGLGFPGFLAGVCFLLFFWSNFLHGNADWLELLLFAAGAACVLLEVFVVPGAIVFGLGGAAMMIAAVVLASQTFVIPSNAYQLRQLPGSLFTVAGAGLGAAAGMYVLQKYLDRVPYLKRLILRPLRGRDLEESRQRESFETFDHLRGQTGVVVTPLVPAGKVRFGEEQVDVVSDGTLLEVGSLVVVTEVLGSRIIVKSCDG